MRRGRTSSAAADRPFHRVLRFPRDHDDGLGIARQLGRSRQAELEIDDRPRELDVRITRAVANVVLIGRGRLARLGAAVGHETMVERSVRELYTHSAMTEVAVGRQTLQPVKPPVALLTAATRALYAEK